MKQIRFLTLVSRYSASGNITAEDLTTLAHKPHHIFGNLFQLLASDTQNSLCDGFKRACAKTTSTQEVIKELLPIVDGAIFPVKVRCQRHDSDTCDQCEIFGSAAYPSDNRLLIAEFRVPSK
jgi:hypothetical protein